MLKLLKKYFKSIAAMLVFAIALLVFQAYSDLSLPEYMSAIVDTGIQQGGIDSAAPETIRQSQMNNLLSIVDGNEKDEILNAYELKGNIYERTVKNKDALASLEVIMGKALILLNKIEETAGMPFDEIPAGALTYGLAADVGNPFEGMSDSIITQSAITYVRAEYEAQGKNLDKIQSNYILKKGGEMLLFALLIMLSAIAATYLSSRIAALLAKNMRRDVYSKVVEFSNSEFDKFSTASLITRSTNDVQQIQQVLPMLIRIVFYAPIMGVGGVFKVMKTDVSMTWIIGLALLLLACMILTMFRVVMPKIKIMQKLIDKVNLIMREALSGMLVIRAFNTQKHEEQRFDEANTALTGNNLFVTRTMSMMMPFMMVIMNLTQLLIVWVGAKSIDAGNMQVGDMFAFIQYSMQILMSFLFISMISVMLPRATVSANRILEVLNSETSIKDPDGSKRKKFRTDSKGVVEFKNVCFKYPDADDYVLKNISFTAKAGQTTAFIGSTGSGKSTLINLIPRFYDVTDGEILVNGTDIRQVTQSELRDCIGYVPQKGLLFSGTIESNIKFGGDKITDDQMKKAAQIAQADEFIHSKQEQYNEPISQGGTNVSGGQKQRLSIARALAKNPDIYIFDDSFSALDFKTDAALRKTLSKEISHATLLIVAQRIGTIKTADQIVVLNEGEMAGIGTHRQLLENCEVYRQIALSQLSQEELDREFTESGEVKEGALSYE